MKIIDVSKHNKTINWDDVKNQIDGAILRLGWIGNKENHTIDPQFERNYNECKRLKIPIGVYVYNYCIHESTVLSGAKWTIKQLQGKDLELPVYFDIEEESMRNMGKEKLTNLVIAFNTEIENAGFWAGIYANRNWYNNYLHKELLIKRYTSWIAHFQENTELYRNEYDMLQYTSKGNIDGIVTNVDLNIMYRDLILDIQKWKNKKVENTIQQNENTTQQNEIEYIVKKGDCLSKIAKKFNTTVQAIAEKNGITNVDLIYENQKLII